MRLVTYASPASGADRVGVLADGHVHGLAAPIRLLDLLGDDGAALAAAGARALADPVERLPEADVRLRAPVPVPPSIRDFMAFEAHVVTSMRAMGGQIDPDWYEIPVFYFTNPAAVYGPYDDVPMAPGTAAWDYELEVAAVIGRAGGDLTPEQGVAAIAGYTILCDWSARDLQGREMRLQLGPAKGKDTATSLGPWLVTPDELADRAAGRAYDLAMTASVNGRPCSAGTLADLYWSFGQMVAYASRGTRLVPGDVVGTGTVGTGCLLELSRVHGSDAYPWLAAGDVVRLEVDRLGAIQSRVVPGAAARSLR